MKSQKVAETADKSQEDKLIQVTIRGSVPLLQHKIDLTKSGKPDPNIPDIELAKLALYVTPEGEAYQPAEHIEGALKTAGAQFMYKGKKTYKDFIESGVTVHPAAIIHKNQNWEVDKRVVVVNRARIVRLRPIFKEWELDFELLVINPNIKITTLSEILTYAGKFVGIGDYRPKYGRFIVTKFKYD